jgi:hypothetical protein
MMSKEQSEKHWTKFILLFWPLFAISCFAIVITVYYYFNLKAVAYISLLATGILTSYYAHLYSDKSFGYTVSSLIISSLSPLGSIIGYMIALNLKNQPHKEQIEATKIKEHFANQGIKVDTTPKLE